MTTRADALAACEHNAVSRLLIRRFPALIAHPAPRGVGEWCLRDGDVGGALACSAPEAYLLHRLCLAGEFARPLEIGAYVGWSTAHMALGLTARLDVVDPFTEGEAVLYSAAQVATLRRFTDNMRACGLREQINLVLQPSPQALAQIQRYGTPWDFVFIDGWHADGQPSRDVAGVLPYLTERAIIALHDTWMPDVAAAGDLLTAAGWTAHQFETANLLTVYYRAEPPWWRQFVEGS